MFNPLPIFRWWQILALLFCQWGIVAYRGPQLEFPLPLGKGFYREPDFSQLAVDDIFGHFLLRQH
jgi:hypothetical protein